MRWSPIVSEKLAREFWKGGDPVGRRIEIGEDGPPAFQFTGGSPVASPTIGRTRTVEIVGVVEEIRDGLIIGGRAPGHLPSAASRGPGAAAFARHGAGDSGAPGRGCGNRGAP